MSDTPELFLRKGKIEISKMLLRESPKELMKHVFSKILIVRAEMLHYNMSIEYVGYSKHFDKVDVGEEVPYYSVQITRNKEGDIEGVEFERW